MTLSSLFSSYDSVIKGPVHERPIISELSDYLNVTGVPINDYYHFSRLFTTKFSGYEVDLLERGFIPSLGLLVNLRFEVKALFKNNSGKLKKQLTNLPGFYPVLVESINGSDSGIINSRFNWHYRKEVANVVVSLMIHNDSGFHSRNFFNRIKPSLTASKIINYFSDSVSQRTMLSAYMLLNNFGYSGSPLSLSFNNGVLSCDDSSFSLQGYGADNLIVNELPDELSARSYLVINPFVNPLSMISEVVVNDELLLDELINSGVDKFIRVH